MDIVSRLKEFINYLNIPVTQFADACKIPRPTLSQLLNGRNKKVSDELLRKLHTEYPSLNVLWLLYGEGDMLCKNNGIQTLQNSLNFNRVESKQEDKILTGIAVNFPEKDSPLKKNGTSINNNNNSTANQSVEKSNNKIPIGKTEFPEYSTESESHVDSRKKIVNIIVYYNDNSFESFIPDGKGIS